MSQRLGTVVLAAGVLFAGLSFAQDPPAEQPDDPPVRLKKKNKPDTDKPAPSKAPMKDDKKEPPKDDKKEPKKDEAKGEPESAQPQEDEAEVLNRVAKNVRMAEEKIANKELGDGTRQLQEDILKDLDSLIRAAESPPPQGAGGGSDDSNPDKANDPKSQDGTGSMGKQQGQQGSGSQRAQRAQRRRQGSGTQQAKKGGSGQPMPDMGMGMGDQGTQQAKNSSSGNGGAGTKGMEGPNKNADLYKDVWGHLPEALRAEMNAYSNDKQFMAKYDELIKRYYRSIAEEGRKKGGD